MEHTSDRIYAVLPPLVGGYRSGLVSCAERPFLTNALNTKFTGEKRGGQCSHEYRHNPGHDLGIT